MNAKDLPKFSALPKVPGLPHGCAWGLFDHDGQRDNVGTLNLLVPEVVKSAKDEIQDGISVALNWPIHNLEAPGFGREPPVHEIKSLKPLGFHAHDDILHLNTQSGSQWDGLKHFGHQETGQYYNNLAHDDVSTTTDNGIHHWSDRGGIVGRGVLLDYVRYAAKHGIAYDVASSHGITKQVLVDMAKDENVELRVGDILIVRSGFTKWYKTASKEEREAHVTKGGPLVGVTANEETVEWLWDSHFSAIAGDTVSFEVWPPQSSFILHTYALAFWGMPIGEMWDLERLSEVCEAKQRWSFFFTSAPLNVVGGVATPANALAIF